MVNNTNILYHIVFTALRGMQTRYSDEKAVRPSVHLSIRLSNAWIVTKRKKDLSRFSYHTKEHLASFLRRKMVVGGRPLLPEIFGQLTT